ncbi:MAG: elongation factor P 5-aminopentanone reductase [Huintestinicola sp.]
MNKTVLITGASRGIGRETAKLFAAEGYRVAANYSRSEEAALSLKNEICGKGGICEIFRADISHSGQVSRMFAEIGSIFGGTDILICNAGIAEQALFTDITEDMWDRMFGVNVKGTYLCCREALPHMIHNKSGRIITVSSMWGISGASCEVHYSASKAAVIGLTKALAKEVGLSGITVNCIAPGVISTEMNAHLDEDTMNALAEETPLNRLGTPYDVASAVLFLASEKASFITGQVLSVDGGFIV